MENAIQVLAVEQDGVDGIIVKFSDGTAAGYVVEELLELRPKRAWTMPDEMGLPESIAGPTASSMLQT